MSLIFIPYFFTPFHQILVHLGLLTKESGFKIAENAFSGGPLGELVQWSDLITTLYLLGHDVRISASLAELKELVPYILSIISCLKFTLNGQLVLGFFSHWFCISQMQPYFSARSERSSFCFPPLFQLCR